MRSEQSMSISRGEPASRQHNVIQEYREGLAHVDARRTSLNIVLEDTPLEKLYEQEFGEALAAYNEKQVAAGRPGRQIIDYLGKIQASKQEKPSYELVVQIGSRETNPATDGECRQVSEVIYRHFYQRFKEDFPQFAVVNAAIHFDEQTPHLHIQYVPVARAKGLSLTPPPARKFSFSKRVDAADENEKAMTEWRAGRTEAMKKARGIAIKNSHSQAMKQMGFHDSGEVNQRLWQVLEEEAEKVGVKRLDMHVSRPHMDVHSYKAFADAVNKARDYRYKNDPELLGMVVQGADAADEVSKGMDEGIAALGWAVSELDEMVDDLENKDWSYHSPWEYADRAREIADRLHDAHKEMHARRGGIREWAQAARERVRALPGDWRDYIVHPIAEWLRKAREAFVAADERGSDVEEPTRGRESFKTAPAASESQSPTARRERARTAAAITASQNIWGGRTPHQPKK